MKAFEIKLEHHDQFCFYLREDHIITLITDEQYPYPCNTKYWVKETNSFENKHPFPPAKILCPTIVTKKEDFLEYLSIYIPQLIKNYCQLLKNETDLLIQHVNVILLTKDWNDFVEIGMCIRGGEYHHINEYAQKITNSYLALKAFW